MYVPNKSKDDDFLKKKTRREIDNIRFEKTGIDRKQLPMQNHLHTTDTLTQLIDSVNYLKQKNKIQDEATLFIENNFKIKFIKGETLNNKITFKEDIDNTKTYFGIGFDIHKLIKQKKLFLGGIQIPYHSGLKGHSDGDVIIHSIIDALLGALNLGDIGENFPNTSEYLNVSSIELLKKVKFLLKDQGMTIKGVKKILNNKDIKMDNKV